jgi:hypothetical protein
MVVVLVNSCCSPTARSSAGWYEASGSSSRYHSPFYTSGVSLNASPTNQPTSFQALPRWVVLRRRPLVALLLLLPVRSLLTKYLVPDVLLTCIDARSGGPPPPPAAPAVKVGGGAPAEGRGALLSSIAGFSKGGLKKATTVDKSAPILSTISLFLSKAGANASADPPCTYRRAPSYCTETEKAPPGGGGPMGGLFAGGIPKLGGRGRATASPPVGGPRT